MSDMPIYNDTSIHAGDAPVNAKVTVFKAFTTLELEVGPNMVRFYVKDVGDVVKVASAMMAAAVSPKDATHI